MSENIEQIPEHIAAIAESGPPSARELIEFCYLRLVEEGVKPKYEKIREKIAKIRPDGKGPSYTAMSPIVQELRKRERASAQVVVAEMPQSLAEMLTRVGDNFWRSATELAGQKVESVQKGAETRVKEAEEETSQFKDENTRLDQDLERIAVDHEKLKAELSELNNKLQTALQEKAGLEGERKGLLSDKKRLEDELKAEKALNISLRSELDKLKPKYEKAVLERDNYEGAVIDMDSEKIELSGKLNTSTTNEAKLKQEVDALKAKLEQEKTTLKEKCSSMDKLMEDNVQLSANFMNAKVALETCKAQDQRISEELAKLKEKHEGTLLELGSWKEKHKQLEKKR